MPDDASHEMVMLEAEEGMEKAVEFMVGHFRTIRTGRATPALVENIKVQAYGSEMTMKQVGAISVPEARLLAVKPFDPNIIKDIEKAILASDLGVTPQNDGKIIRLQFPSLNEDRRKQLAGDVRKMGEEAKVVIRAQRRDTNKALEKLQKEKALTEDDLDRLKKDLDDMTKTYEKKVDTEIERKTEEIMEI